MVDIPAGTTLGRYSVISKIGKGGMGEVYLAHDARLGRNVALKILPPEAAVDKGRMRRFVQEAKAAAALNHPNIAHIYEIGEEDAVSFIAMEFVDGQTLREIIDRGQTGLPKLLRYLQHTAEGLAKAHAAGIVHRDLKPENIMVTNDGHAKILDFGLAKLIEQDQPGGVSREGMSAMPTAIIPQHSQPGTVLGTVGYMSPEQARGRVNEIDHRSDIFSFGCILFEAATRHRAFEGKDALDSLHNIVHAPTPQIRDVNPSAPDELQKIVRRCLAKDPDERYQSIKDVAIEIKDVRREMADDSLVKITEPTSTSGITGSSERSETGPTSATTACTPAAAISTHPSSVEYIVSGIRSHKRFTGLVLGVLVIAAVAIGYLVYRYLNQKETFISFQSAKFTRLTSTGKATAAAISPDGKWLVYIMDDGEQQSLWLRQVAVANSNTQIIPPAEVQFWGLNFSPDGNYVYYTVHEGNTSSGTLYQMPVLGGTGRKLLAGVDSSVSFSPDRSQIAFFSHYEDEDRVMTASADGTGERQLAARHANEYFFSVFLSNVSWSPDGKIVATPVGSIAENFMTVAAVPMDGGDIKFFCPKKWQTVQQVEWLPDGGGLLVTAQERGADPFTFGIWQVTYPGGEARKVTNDLNSYRSISLSSDGSLLAAVQIAVTANIWVMPGFDSARATQITQGTSLNGPLTWTPDGKIVYSSNASGNINLFVVDPRGENPKQLTAESSANGMPSVSPDGRYIVFVSLRAGVPHIWRIDSDGGNPKQLTDRFDITPTVSPDGKWVVYGNNVNKGTLWKVPIDGGQAVQITDKFSMWPAISPDGRQIACYYIEGPNAPLKLAVLPFGGGEPVKLLPAPNVDPGSASSLRWTSDGLSIVYRTIRNGVGNLWAQPVDGGSPKQLTNFASDRIFFFDFSRDGKQTSLSRGTVTNDAVLISDFR